MATRKTLTTAQQQFIDKYLKLRDVDRAAAAAGYRWPVGRTGFYVYLLVDPRGGDVFYVGKGRGRRITVHASRGRHHNEPNGAKMRRMQSIFDAGLSVGERVFIEGLDEVSAFAAERSLIHELRGAGLTNIASGAVSSEEAVQDGAAVLLCRMLPFEQWLRQVPADGAAWIVRSFGSLRDFYDWMTRGLECLRDGQRVHH